MPSSLFLSLWADQIQADSTANQIACSVALACRAMEVCLVPIIGKRGMDALFHRSLHLTGRSHVWLAETLSRSPAAMDVEALKAVLAVQTSAEASAGGQLLLKTLTDLLVNLIGPSLTERLLRSISTTAQKDAQHVRDIES